MAAKDSDKGSTPASTGESIVTLTTDPTDEALLQGPQGAGFFRFTDLLNAGDDTFIIMDWGLEGTGKTLWAIKNMPLPIMILNLDRPMTKAHLGMLPKARAEQIFIKNLRDSVKDINHYEALSVKDGIEAAIADNLAWLKGGTVIIDGGTALRDVLKLADPTIGAKMEAGKRFNPKDKAQVNAWHGAAMGEINDKGINLVITCHAANSWAMKTTQTDEGPKQALMRTNNMYPKYDDIGFERANMSLLFFKRCECGRNIINQDGTCVNQSDPFEDRPAVSTAGHQGRKHMVRIVANKFNTAVEGTEWENLDMRTLKILCFEPLKAVKMMEAL